MDGIGLLTKLTAEGGGLHANMAVVVLTAMGSIELAVDAMKLGAYDFCKSRSTQPGFGQFWAMPHGSARPKSNWRWRGDGCARPACWVAWWGIPGPCARFSD